MPTTATEWLDEWYDSEDVTELEAVLQSAGLPYGIITELPESLKQSIARGLGESFSQDYWQKIAETTGGEADEIIRRGLEEGQSIRDIARQIRESLIEGGEGERRADIRAYNIARTESANALNSGRRAAIDDFYEQVGEDLPIKTVWLSVLGNTTRPEHAELDGVPADKNGMWNLAGYEVPWPGHWSLPPSQRCNCFPMGTLVSGDFVGAQRAWYDGAIAEIETESGARISLTPQHPVVTSKGLVPAGEIQPGDQVLTYCVQVDSSATESFDSVISGSGCCDGIENKPVPIEQVFEAMLARSIASTSFVEVRRAEVDDFYGDGKSIQGDVEIVRPDWELLNDGEVGEFQERGDSVFIFENRQLPFESSSGTLGLNEWAVGLALPCPPSSPDLPFNSGPIGLQSVPLQSLRVGLASHFDARLDESSLQDGPAISSFLRELQERFACCVPSDQFAKFGDCSALSPTRSPRRGFGFLSEVDAVLADEPFHDAIGASNLFGKVGDRVAGLVRFDQVAQVRRRQYIGHVFDLHSRFGLVVASDPQDSITWGIVTSNCRCSLITEMGMTDDDALAELEAYQERVAEGKSVGCCGEKDGQKGDAPGHPFRGNQWSGGQGGSNEPPSLPQQESPKQKPKQLSRASLAKLEPDYDQVEDEVKREAMRTAVGAYYNGQFEAMNGSLRSGEKADEEVQTYNDNLKAIFEELGHPLKADTMLYRYVKKMPFDVTTPGAEFEDKGFVSTTADKNLVHDLGIGGDVSERKVFNIRVPEGTKVISGMGGRDASQEVTLPPGLKFRVVSLGKKTYWGQVVNLEVVT